MTRTLRQTFSMGAAALLLAGCAWPAAAVAQDVPTLEVQSLVTPVVTARNFSGGIAPNPRGGYNWVGQFMNYRSTGGRAKATHELPSGEHYLAYVDTEDRPEAEWVVVDLETGEHRIFDLPGFHSAIPPALAGNGRLFFSVDYGHIYYYDPVDETVKILGRTHDDMHTVRQYYKLLVGPDGMIYGSAQATTGMTSVIRINPDTLEYKVITEVGVPGRRNLTYGYYLAMDPPWVYVGVGQDKWELWAVNLDSGEKQMLAERIGEGARVTVQQGGDGLASAGLSGEPGAEKVLLSGGQIVARAPVSEAYPENAPERREYEMVQWQASTPVQAGPAPELEAVRGLAIDANGAAVVRWRPADEEGEWRTAAFSINRAEPEPFESLTVLPDGSILGSVRQYHGWFRYDPETNQYDYFGKGGPSGAKTTIIDGKVYFSGYPNTTLYVYDPEKPWHEGLTEAADANPRKIGSQGQGRSEAHHSTAMANADGRAYTMGKRSRWSTGTGLVAYDPQTNEFIALGEANKDLDPVDMIAMPAMQRIIVSGAKPDAELLVYDLDLNEVDRITLQPGLANTGDLLAVSDSRFLGWYADPTSEKTVLYLCDLADKAQVQSVSLEAGSGPVLHRPVDNTFWIITDAGLGRLDPATLTIEPAAKLASGIGRPTWVGHELYGHVNGELVKLSQPLP